MLVDTPKNQHNADQRVLEHLQAAAREVIHATRAFLDAAEDLVDDPKVVQDIMATVATVAAAAADRLRSPGAAPSADGTDDGDDDGVQRIRVS